MVPTIDHTRKLKQADANGVVYTNIPNLAQGRQQAQQDVESLQATIGSS